MLKVQWNKHDVSMYVVDDTASIAPCQVTTQRGANNDYYMLSSHKGVYCFDPATDIVTLNDRIICIHSWQLVDIPPETFELYAIINVTVNLKNDWETHEVPENVISNIREDIIELLESSENYTYSAMVECIENNNSEEGVSTNED